MALLPLIDQALELGTAIRELQAVVLHQRPAHEARGDVVLVLRVDVLAFAEVDDDGLPGVRQFHGLRLRLAQFRPVAVSGLRVLRAKVRELHPVERKVALLPLLAPLLDHEGEELRVFAGAAGVALALIPDHALDAVAERGVHHAGEDVAGAGVPGQAFAAAKQAGAAAAAPASIRLLQRLHIRLPLRQRGFVIRLRLVRLQIDLALLPALHQQT